jgi:peptidoglycan/LPS O-acetylase OafA/YrhL
MGRNLYILAATLCVLALVSGVVSFTNIAQQPGSPGDQALWRTMGLGLLVLSLLVTLAGILASLFEQAERRAELQRQNERDNTRRRNRP